jgi:hypothetical protein
MTKERVVGPGREVTDRNIFILIGGPQARPGTRDGKGRVAERVRTLFKGRGGIWGGEDAFSAGYRWARIISRAGMFLIS